jgi:hypothetical protein
VLADGAISYELLLACLKGVRERGGRERERQRGKRERDREKRERAHSLYLHLQHHQSVMTSSNLIKF